ncbi:MAG: hypothetical protein WBA51_14385 [Erythrobacter sp.]
MGRTLLAIFLRIIGVALIVSGVMWALQGMGILMWPAESFMLARREWGLYGAITAVIGLVIVLMAGRISRK